MALTPSGAISLGGINTALNRSATAAINMNDAQVRFLANQISGSVNMNAMRNKQSTVGTITVGEIFLPKASIFGYSDGFYQGGSLSSNTFIGTTISSFYSTDYDSSITVINSNGTTSGTLRLSVLGSTYTLPTRSGEYFLANAGSSIFLTRVNQTITFQFAT